MKLYTKFVSLLVVLIFMVGCNSNSSSPESVPKFADWELDSLKELSSNLPFSEILKHSQFSQRWYITVYTDGTRILKFPNGGGITSSRETPIDKDQFIDFRKDGSFELSLTNSSCNELKDKIDKLFGEEFSHPGKHYGTYKCYNVVWAGDGEYDGNCGVVLFDKDNKELGRFKFEYYMIDAMNDGHYYIHEFSLDKVVLQDQTKDIITSTDDGLCLNNDETIEASKWMQKFMK